MEKISIEGKSLEEAKKNACEALNASENEIVIIEKEEKKGLFSKKVVIEAITKVDINQAIKDYLIMIIKGIGIEANIETKIREDIPHFNIIANDSILIGRNGRTLDAIQAITNAMLSNELKEHYKIFIDVNDYKQKREGRLEKLAKYTAKEVAKTKVEVKLDPMNSYERRIIHNTLTNSKDVTTESVGEEPNRCVVIKPKED